MKTKKQIKILTGIILTIISGLAASYLVFTQSNSNPSPNQPVMIQVYYAVEHIPQASFITREMLDTFSIPQEHVNDVMFEVGEEDELIGMIAYLPLEKGALITAPLVKSPDELLGQIHAPSH